MEHNLGVLRSVKIEDLLKLSMVELERLTGLYQSALVQKCNLNAQQIEAKLAKTEENRRAELAYAPTIAKLFSDQPVKLNVGGTYFATHLDHLLREENSFFSVKFGGKWPLNLNPKDDAVFIDRSPTVFAAILDYLRTGSIDLANMSEMELKAVRVEADYYQISSLLALLPSASFSPQGRGRIQLSRLDSVATLMSPSAISVVLACQPFSPTSLEKTIKILRGTNFMIGVAPATLVTSTASGCTTCGWHLSMLGGTLFGCNGKNNAPYQRAIAEGSLLVVKLDQEFNIRFLVNGEDWGVAYEKVATDFTSPLYLSVTFSAYAMAADAVQLI